jgi:hypothetical protein
MCHPWYDDEVLERNTRQLSAIRGTKAKAGWGR